MRLPIVGAQQAFMLRSATARQQHDTIARQNINVIPCDVGRGVRIGTSIHGLG